MQERGPRPEEPLHIFGGECPAGYEYAGHCCPRDEAQRCPGCDDKDDCYPTQCGHGVKVYKSDAWKAWGRR